MQLCSYQSQDNHKLDLLSSGPFQAWSLFKSNGYLSDLVEVESNRLFLPLSGQYHGNRRAMTVGPCTLGGSRFFR
jgi:hypothetical protein